jgi:cobalt-zinc-cadmium resistance protein CzcA
MVQKLIGWSLNNPLVIVLVGLALLGVGAYSFLHVNVEAYPDPAPPIVEIVATTNGMSTEEVERQVSIPLEVTFAGMPGLKYIRSKSLFGLSHLRIQFDYGTDYLADRQEVINRLSTISQPLPPNVSPQISPESPTGEIFRYTLNAPKDEYGRDIYTLNDLKAMQDWVLERQFRQVPRIVDVSSSGGTIRRYEIQPDPARMSRYQLKLSDLQNAIGNSNMNVGGDLVSQGPIMMNARSVALFRGAEDPVRKVVGMKDPDPAAAAELEKATRELADDVAKLREARKFSLFPSDEAKRRADELEAAVNKKYDEVRDLKEAQRRRIARKAAAILRDEERKRIEEIRQLVITSVNGRPIRVEDVVEGGRLGPGELPGQRGVVVSHQTRLGMIGHGRRIQGTEGYLPHLIYDSDGNIVGYDEPDKVQCIVLLRKLEDSLPAIHDVEAKVKELNDPQSGRMLPGVEIEPYYDRAELINVTTETVQENLLMGITLVTAILFMFLSNVRTALIVAINIPLALLFAFSMLFLRGKSANLLSIGAVDFGIIVDSSVIMVENVYRHLATGEHAELPLKDRILRSSGEITRPLLFSTLIMVCAFLPLFTMRGPEGQLFGPMADTYAFALGGALVLAVTLTPVLCMFFFKTLKPTADNLLVRILKVRYLNMLKLCLRFRWVTIAVMGGLIVGTCFLVPHLGNEFMPELEEGNLWIRGTSSLNTNLEWGANVAKQARTIMMSYPEVEQVISQLGRPDDGTDSCGFYNCEYFVPLKPQSEWPAMIKRTTWLGRLLYGEYRPRTKPELIKAMNDELDAKLPGTNWGFSQNIRDNVMESLSGIKGDNSVKIFGPELEKLQEHADDVKKVLQKIPGIENVGVYDIRGQTNLELRIDPKKCEKMGVQAADVSNVIASALGARALTTMVEGEKLFDVSVRWPKWRRSSESSILDIPVDIVNNQVVVMPGPGFTPSPYGSSMPLPSIAGSYTDTRNNITITPRWRLRDLVTPVGEDGRPYVPGYRLTDASLAALRRAGLSEGLLGGGAFATEVLAKRGVPPAILDKLSSWDQKDKEFATRYEFTRELKQVLPEQGDFQQYSGRIADRAKEPDGSFVRPGSSTIYREQGSRLIAVRFSVRGRDLGSAVREAQEATSGVVKSPYRMVWSGEFEEMEQAERRLLYIIPLSLTLIFILLYMAFRSLIDALAVFTNVIALSLGGIWTLWLTDTNFSISAAVGFVSLFGVAIMDGLLLISSFNSGRARGMPLQEAILAGAEKRVRPVMMTALTAVLGLLPAALSTKIGAQTQRPLAVVVVGGMLTTLFLTRYLMPVLYSFYGHREPPEGAGDLAH